MRPAFSGLTLLYVNAIWSKVRSYCVNVQWLWLLYCALTLYDLKSDHIARPYSVNVQWRKKQRHAFSMLPLLYINAIWSKVRSYSVNVQWLCKFYCTLTLYDLNLDHIALTYNGSVKFKAIFRDKNVLHSVKIYLVAVAHWSANLNLIAHKLGRT